MLELVKLEQFAKRKPHQLSGGQRQRVALARSVAKRPKVLLLDEPLGALDKKLREETQFELMDLQQELGLTFVVVTHDQEEAMTMADRIAIMDKGKVMQVATPAEVYEAPASRFVADFVGTVNMFEGKVTSARQRVRRHRFRQRPQLRDRQCAAMRRRQHGMVRGAAREDQGVVEAAGGRQPQRGRGRGLGHRLSRRHDPLPHPPRRRPHRARQPVNAERTSQDPLTWNDRAWMSFRPDAGVVLTK